MPRLIRVGPSQREIFPLALPHVGKSVRRPSLEHPRPHIMKLFENPSKSICKYRLKTRGHQAGQRLSFWSHVGFPTHSKTIKNQSKLVPCWLPKPFKNNEKSIKIDENLLKIAFGAPWGRPGRHPALQPGRQHPRRPPFGSHVGSQNPPNSLKKQC